MIEKINRGEAVRYLGAKTAEMTPEMEKLLSDCESELLSAAVPKYLYRKVELKDSGLVVGEDVKAHLSGCNEGYLVCATLGGEVDRLIRSAQITDMAKAVVFDALASALIEQVCSEVDELIAAENAGKFLTWRFAPGYGDYPLRMQEKFLALLDAPRKIGLCANDSSMLTPTKSVTAILGVSENELPRKKRGCAVCNMAKTCKFRKVGTRCEF